MKQAQDKNIVLIVDDNPTNLNVLMDFLQDSGYTVLVATDGASAVRRAQYAQPDIVLLDVMMTDMDGYETCQRLKEDATTAGIPVIFMTALSDIADKVRGFHVGGVDYITKPLQREEVLVRLNTHLKIHRQKLEIEVLRDQDRQFYEKLSRMKDEFVHAASHDLRNPLSTIFGSLELFRDLVDVQDAEARQCLDNIERSAEQMRHLITDILELAKLETGNALSKDEQDLTAFIELTLADLSLEAQEQDIQLIYQAPAEAVWAQFDRHRFSQVVNNLVRNGIKYNRAGGFVRVELSRNPQHICLSVEDNGIGIPDEDMPNIFRKFYRSQHDAHRMQEGTGLGLSIVQAIVEQHDGEIRATSQLGVGSKFILKLPQ